MGCEELQQLVLHVGQVERLGVDGGLVGLEVQHQRSVLHQLRADPASGAPEEMTEAGLELPRCDGATQKSSNRSSRSSRSLSWSTLTMRSNGWSGMSRLRSARHNANAPSPSLSAQTMAPAQPSSGSTRLAAALPVTAFHG